MKNLLLITLLICSFNLIAKTETNPELQEALSGIQSEDKETLKTSLTYILQHQSDVPSTHLLFASAQAFSINQLEIASYLYYAGQLRAKFDLQRFPPIDKSGSSPSITLINMIKQVGSVINPEIYRKPKLYQKVIGKLANFTLSTSKNYNPGWKYKHQMPIDQQRVLLLNIANNDLKQLADFGVLLNTQEYFNAFTVLQRYYSLSEDAQQLQIYIVEKDKAEAKMLEIETSLNIIGKFYKGTR